MKINIKRYMDDGYGNTHLVDEILNNKIELWTNLMQTFIPIKNQ